MEYDPIKKTVGTIFNQSPFLRILFYRLLDLLLLRTWHIHKVLRQMDKTSALSILDAGSGFGQYSYWMCKHFANSTITAVDVKEDQIEECSRFFSTIGKPTVQFKVSDLTTYQHANQFDLALSVDVMEHILEDVLVFKNIHTSLKQGGMLLISTPSDKGGSDVHENNEGSFIGEHVRDGYNIHEIKEKLLLAGFSRVEPAYAYGTPGKISWRLSMKYPMQLLNTSKLFFIVLPFYFIIAYPIAFVLNYADTHATHPTGTGLIVKAFK
jgi:SAM-dependent methyltransferase